MSAEDRERYAINVRYAREFRDDIEALKRVMVPTPAGAQIPLSQLAEIRRMLDPELGEAHKLLNVVKSASGEELTTALEAVAALCAGAGPENSTRRAGAGTQKTQV